MRIVLDGQGKPTQYPVMNCTTSMIRTTAGGLAVAWDPAYTARDGTVIVEVNALVDGHDVLIGRAEVHADGSVRTKIDADVEVRCRINRQAVMRVAPTRWLPCQ